MPWVAPELLGQSGHAKSSIKNNKREVGNTMFLSSLLVWTAWGLIVFVWQRKLSVGIRAFKEVNHPAVRHAILFLDLFSEAAVSMPQVWFYEQLFPHQCKFTCTCSYPPAHPCHCAVLGQGMSRTFGLSQSHSLLKLRGFISSQACVTCQQGDFCIVHNLIKSIKHYW